MVLSKPTFERVAVVDAAGEPITVRPKVHGQDRIRFFEEPFSGKRKLADLVHDPEVVEAALRRINEDACERAKRSSEEGRTTILFARTVQHADDLADCLEEAGVRPTKLHSRDGLTRQERHRKLQHVREVPDSVLVCVDMLTEGIDLPTAGLLIMARWTCSERLFWQMIGRGLRGPEVGGNAHVEVVTYDLKFGAAEDEPKVQVVDDEMIASFGGHAEFLPESIQVDTPRVPARETPRPRGRPQQRHGYMTKEDIDDREEKGIEGNLFDVVVHLADDGYEIERRPDVRQPWRVLRNLYDAGYRGRRYRFVVTVIED